MEISIIIPGHSQPQERSGERYNGKFIQHYDQKKSKNFKSEIKWFYTFQNAAKRQLIGPLNMAVRIYRPIPKSFSQKKADLAIAGKIRPISRPDLKNHIWICEDALNDLAYKDDSQIVSYDGSGKWYSDKPRTEILISEIGGAENV